MLKFFIATILISILIIPLQAQFVEVGGNVGIMSFMGDVNEGVFLPNSQAGGGGFVRVNVHPHIATRIHFLYGNIAARDNASQAPVIRRRNFSFNSTLTEIALLGEVNILPFAPDRPNAVFSPYLVAGVGMILFNPTTEYDGKTVELQKVGTEGQGLDGYAAPYALTSVAIPLGFGIKYAVSKRINIGMEFAYRFTFTDYLDDVSGVYLSTRELSRNGELAIVLSNRTEEYTGTDASHLVGQRRGNSNNNDGYFVWGLSVSFNFHGKSTYKRDKKRKYKLSKWF